MNDGSGADPGGLRIDGFDYGPHGLIFEEDRVTEYAELSGDHNPIHLDYHYAMAQGLAGPIVHGMLILAGVCGVAQGWAGKDAQLVSVTCRFRRPLLVGERLMVHGRVLVRDGARLDIGIEAISDANEKVLTHSQAGFTISSNRQQQDR